MTDLYQQVLELFAETAPSVFSGGRGIHVRIPAVIWKKINPNANREHAARYRATHRAELLAKANARYALKRDAVKQAGLYRPAGRPKKIVGTL